MFAMVLNRFGTPLQLEERRDPAPQAGEVLLRTQACAVCRTDLHVVDGELPGVTLPIVPGHEIVGVVQALGPGTSGWKVGDRLGVPWLGGTCGSCWYCHHHRENLCDHPVFTGCDRDGGFATHVVARADYCVALPADVPAEKLAPLLCAGVIGWRSLRAAGRDVQHLGIYGFGAAAHLVAQVAQRQGLSVYAFTRPGDRAAQAFARRMDVAWAGDSTEAPPHLLDAAIIFAPAGELVPLALQAVRKGGRVVCGGIHMSDIPSFPYRLLWGERELVSVANLTREDATEFFAEVARAPLDVSTTAYPLKDANRAIEDVRTGLVHGAAVLVF